MAVVDIPTWDSARDQEIATAYDLIIVGAGPAGLSAALQAHHNHLHYLLLEKTDHLADTVEGYQKRKWVMAEPSRIPLRGALWLQESLREDVLGQWRKAVETTGLYVAFNAPVTEIRRENGAFRVQTLHTVYTARRVIIAIGTQGTPRKLEVSGEDLPHVKMRLDDPALYTGQNVVVIGGGDSAIEVAAALAPHNQVTLVVRTREFVRAKPILASRVLDLAKEGQLTIHFGTTVERITPDTVDLKLPSATLR